MSNDGSHGSDFNYGNGNGHGDSAGMSCSCGSYGQHNWMVMTVKGCIVRSLRCCSYSYDSGSHDGY